MAARGTEEKQIVIDKIKEVFPDAFEYDKVIRIPVGDVQIKVALTCAKDNVEPGGDNVLPGTKVTIKEGEEPVFEKVKVEVSDEEKKNLADLMSALNL